MAKAEFLRDLESYYGWWELQWNVVEEVHDAKGHDAKGHDAKGHDAKGHDAKGHDAKGDYIIFRDGLLEAKPAELSRIGSWSFNKNSSPDLREVRALSLFMAWVANSDMKEEGETKIILKSHDQPENWYYTLNDLGWGFGSLYLPESVNWYKRDPIKKVTSACLYLNYMTWRGSKLFDGVTYDDSR